MPCCHVRSPAYHAWMSQPRDHIGGGKKKRRRRGGGGGGRAEGGAKCYVALRQVAALQRVLKVRRMSSQPLRLPLCCFTSTEKSNKNDKCVG